MTRPNKTKAVKVRRPRARRRDLKSLTGDLRQFAAERDWDQFHTPKNLSMALIGEAAEILEHFQWLTPAESRQLRAAKKTEVAEELGDTLIYLCRLADKLEIDLLDAAFDKLEKTRRKYPAQLVKGKAHKHTHYQRQ